MNTNDLSVFFTNQINQLLKFGTLEEHGLDVISSIEQIEDKNSKNLFLAVNELISKLEEANNFVSGLSKGNLDVEVPSHNLIISPFKQLHANLSHLVWQVERISEGDLNQEIDFLGDFSRHFNKLVSFLREKECFERELKISEEKYRLIAENITDVIWVFNLTQNRFTYISPSVIHLTGFTVEEAMQQDLEDSLEPKSFEMVKQKLTNAVKVFLANTDQKISNYNEVQQICKDGKYIWIETVTQLQIAENSDVVLLAVSRNIEKRKKTELQLKKYTEELSQLNDDKDRFLQILAHDLRNPFTALLGFSDLLLNNFREYDPQEIEMQLSMISQSAHSTYNLLNDLLVWAMSQAGKLSFNPIELNFVDTCKEIIAGKQNQLASKKIMINCCEAKSIWLMCDKEMFKTILRNLISNAIKFTHKEGEIGIYVDINEEKAIITVYDNGVGISLEDQIKLWDITKPHTTEGTESERGTGLGLLLCKEFVEKHGEKIWIESELGKGSSFKFTMPLYNPTTSIHL